MACQPASVKFQLRRATASNWSSTNPILKSGEPGFETGTNKLKIGDGVTPWNLLPYITTSPAGPTGIQGPTGADSNVIGPTGPTGIQGPTGASGIQGETGERGIQGETGIQGIQGETGERGMQGVSGERGVQGVIGPTGVQGPTGEKAVGSNIVGTYYSLITQDINGSAGPATVFSYGPTGDYSVGGVTLHGGNAKTRLVVPKTGIYEAWYSMQLHSSVSQDIYTNIWIRKNGVDVPDTNGRIQTKSNTSDSLPIVPYILPLNAGDHIEFVSQTNSANGDIKAIYVESNIGGNIPSIIVGIKQIAVDIGMIGPTGPTGSAGAIGSVGAIQYTDGNGAFLGSTGLVYTSGLTGTLMLDGDFMPSVSNVYNLGSPTNRWKSVYASVATLYLGNEAEIGADNNSIAYANKGFAAPFLNIGPAVTTPLTPGAIGGWQVGPTGTIGTDSYDLIAQQKLTTSGLTGPVYSLIRSSGITGPPGPTGSIAFPSVIHIDPTSTSTTTYTIDLTNVTAGTRYYIRANGSLSSVVFSTPTYSLPSNFYVYLKNASSSDATVYHYPGGVGTLTNSYQINEGNATLPNSTIHKSTNTTNPPFMYVYWNGSNLLMV
jgi:hypothetical protein